MELVGLTNWQAELFTLALLLRVGIASALAAAPFVLIYSGRSNFLRNFGVAWLFAFPVAVVAYTAGYLTGISRSPAVGTVIPAVLAVLAGANIYFSDKEKHGAWFGFGAFAFAVLFYYGTTVGVIDRESGRTGWLIGLSEQEKAVKTWRANRGLPPELSPWMLERD